MFSNTAYLARNNRQDIYRRRNNGGSSTEKFQQIISSCSNTTQSEIKSAFNMKEQRNMSDTYFCNKLTEVINGNDSLFGFSTETQQAIKQLLQFKREFSNYYTDDSFCDILAGEIQKADEKEEEVSPDKDIKMKASFELRVAEAPSNKHAQDEVDDDASEVTQDSIHEDDEESNSPDCLLDDVNAEITQSGLICEESAAAVTKTNALNFNKDTLTVIVKGNNPDTPNCDVVEEKFISLPPQSPLPVATTAVDIVNNTPSTPPLAQSNSVSVTQSFINPPVNPVYTISSPPSIVNGNILPFFLKQLQNFPVPSGYSLGFNAIYPPFTQTMPWLSTPIQQTMVINNNNTPIQTVAVSPNMSQPLLSVGNQIMATSQPATSMSNYIDFQQQSVANINQNMPAQSQPMTPMTPMAPMNLYNNMGQAGAASSYNQSIAAFSQPVTPMSLYNNNNNGQAGASFDYTQHMAPLSQPTSPIIDNQAGAASDYTLAAVQSLPVTSMNDYNAGQAGAPLNVQDIAAQSQPVALVNDYNDCQNQVNYICTADESDQGDVPMASFPNQNMLPTSQPMTECSEIQSESGWDDGYDNNQYDKPAPLNNNNDEDDYMMNDGYKMRHMRYVPPTPRHWTPSQPRGLKFTPKFSNHAKGNFYISKEMIGSIANNVIESFVTDNNQIDEKSVFAYYKESVAMQINDGQIRVLRCKDGKGRIFIDIDLHLKRNRKKIYLIAELNDDSWISRVEWKIATYMTADDIYRQYNIQRSQLPKSSRQMRDFQDLLARPPPQMRSDYMDVVKTILRYTNFRKLPKKRNKQKKDKQNRMYQAETISITQQELRKCCMNSWNRGPVFPVVVIQKNRQWLEWKKFIEVGQHKYIGISLRYHPGNKKWRIACLDYDIGRIYYQHRLVGLDRNNQYNQSYRNLKTYNTVSLDIYQ